MFKLPGVTDAELQAVQLGEMPGFDQTVILSTLGVSESRYSEVKALVSAMGVKMGVLEAFNGQTFLDFSDAWSIKTGLGVTLNVQNSTLSTPSAGGLSLAGSGSDNTQSSQTSVSSYGFVLPVITAQQAELLDQSYNALLSSVYDGLAVDIRLDSYIQEISLTVSELGIGLEFSGMNAVLDSKHELDPVNALIDLIDLQKILGSNTSMAAWSPEPRLSAWMALAVQEGTWEFVESAFVTTSVTGSLSSASSGDDFYLGKAVANNFSGGAGNDFVIGGIADDVLYGDTDNDVLYGAAGNDVLDGGYGNDILDGGAGNDLYNESYGNDTYLFGRGSGTDVIRYYSGSDGTADTIRVMSGISPEEVSLYRSSAVNAGNDLILSINGTTDSIRVQNWVTSPSARIERIEFADGTVWDAAMMLKAPLLAQVPVVGGANADTLTGSAATDWLVGMAGNDTYFVDNAADVVIEAANQGIDIVNSTISLTLPAQLEVLMFAETGQLNGAGNALDNLLRGNASANTLTGGAGHDILEGGAGNDVLLDTDGSGLLAGGVGADTLTGGVASGVFVGGLGNDSVVMAGGNDVLLFNRGDGQDSVVASGSADVLSLGGGIAYADLGFEKSGNDLMLKLGAADQITFKDWYAAAPSRPVAQLQVIAEAMADFVAGGADPLKDQKVENFDFAGLAGAFDAARAADGSLTTWALSNALSNFQLVGSDSAAMGGDLAYQYGKQGSLSGVGMASAMATLSDANLGRSAQGFSLQASVQPGELRLS